MAPRAAPSVSRHRRTTATRTKLVGQFDDMTRMGTPTKSTRTLRLDPPGIDVDVHEATIAFKDDSSMTVLLLIADHGNAAMSATLVNVGATDGQIEAMVRQALGVAK